MYLADFDFFQMDTLSQQELASRLTLNCSNSYVQPQEVQVLSSHVTIIVVSKVFKYMMCKLNVQCS